MACDVVCAGSLVLDAGAGPVSLGAPIGGGVLHEVDRVQLVPGGCAGNVSIVLSRMGLSAAVCSRVGDDSAGRLLRDALGREGVDTTAVTPTPGEATSTAVVLRDPSGERSFLAAGGAHKGLTTEEVADACERLRPQAVLIGYFSRLPALEPDLPRLLEVLKEQGVTTAMDAGGDGGSMQALSPCLPWLDVYAPSEIEARNQTGTADPSEMIRVFREHGAVGWLAITLGARGSQVQAGPGEAVLHVPPADPLGPVVDTTGAGDAFTAGLIAGRLRGLNLRSAAQLAAQQAARVVTQPGGHAGAILM
ncbi:MAG: carbohydrate kinase family protein [Planctomycetota bacterium]